MHLIDVTISHEGQLRTLTVNPAHILYMWDADKGSAVVQMIGNVTLNVAESVTTIRARIAGQAKQGLN